MELCDKSANPALSGRRVSAGRVRTRLETSAIRLGAVCDFQEWLSEAYVRQGSGGKSTLSGFFSGSFPA